MAAPLQDAGCASKTNTIGLPNEILSRILLQASTPTFIQLIQTSKELHNVARAHRRVLLHHLQTIPGDKRPLTDPCLNNEELFMLLRQRAAHNLNGTNFTANMTEYTAKAALDPSASNIAGLADDYVRMALVYKDSGDIRHYTKECIVKEVLVQQPGTKIFKTYQQNNTVSVLCAWPQETEEDFTDSESEDELCLENPFPPTAHAQLTRLYHAQKKKTLNMNQGKEKEVDMDYQKPTSPTGNRYVYRIVHFDIYTMEDSRTFTIHGYRDYVPRDFVVNNLDQCAILWDREMPGGRPTEDATIVYYSAKQAQFHYATNYDARTVWSKTDIHGKPLKDNEPEYIPERIAFFKDGRRIKVYGAGGAVPYHITSTSTSQQDPLYAPTNIIAYEGFSFHVDTPFFGTHATHYDDLHQQNWCFLTHLCLGVTTLNMGDEDEENKVKVLCILRSQIRLYAESCKHDVNFSRMYHVSGQNATVVARLWGWEEMHTNFTGHETISISPEGTRIAIAMWNKVYVYPLNPRILCEENPVDHSDDDSQKPKKKKKKPRDPWDHAPSAYYERKKDKNLLNWRIAELRPIVLDLQGAVAHKMHWSRARGPVTDTNSPVSESVEAPSKYVDTNSEDTVTVMPDQLSETMTETTTLSTVVTAIQEADGVEEDPLVFISPGVEAQEGLSQPASASTQQSADSKELPGAITTLQEGDEEKAADPAQKQILNSNEFFSTTTDPADEPMEEKTALQTPISSGSSSAPSIKEHEALASLTNSVILATPPSNLSLLNSPLSPSPFSSVSASNTTSTQSLKSPPRKKEKLAEITNLENTAQCATKEMTSTGDAQHAPEHKAPAEPSAPLLPVLSKDMSKSKQIVSELFSTVTVQASQSAKTNQLLTEPESTQPVATKTNMAKMQLEALQAEPEPKIDIPNFASEISVHPEDAVHDSQATAVEADYSDTSSSTALAPEPVSKVADAAQKPAQKIRVKRITEDELMVLTDRGIQIWNLSVRATGKRVKKMLPLNETLKGKLPTRKSKQKAPSMRVDDKHQSDPEDRCIRNFNARQHSTEQIKRLARA